MHPISLASVIRRLCNARSRGLDQTHRPDIPLDVLFFRSPRPGRANPSDQPFGVALFVLVVLLTAFTLFPGPARTSASETDAILDTADSLFSAMKDRKYPHIWSLLSKKTQDSIVQNVVKAEVNTGRAVASDQVKADFTAGGPLSQAYWNAYVEVFNPDMVLKESAWKMGEVRKNEAQVILQHRKASQPALLQMKKEGGAWKVGLEETFGSLRWVVSTP